MTKGSLSVNSLANVYIPYNTNVTTKNPTNSVLPTNSKIFFPNIVTIHKTKPSKKIN